MLLKRRPSLFVSPIRVLFASLLGAALATHAVAQSPDAAGPWDVGIETVPLNDPTGAFHDLIVEAFYPIDSGSLFTSKSYDIGAVFGFHGYMFQAPMGLDGPPVSQQGPFPTIVYSHRHFGERIEALLTHEILASHGFIVLSVDHPGDTFADTINDTVAPPARVDDVKMVLDLFEQKNADPFDPFFQRIDVDRIGIMGLSFGGNTAVKLAGGSATEPGDPRVKAIFPIAPVLDGTTVDSLANVSVPAFVLGGELDWIAPTANAVALYDGFSSSHAYRGEIQSAGHGSMSETECIIVDQLINQHAPTPLVNAYNSRECYDPTFLPIEEGQRLTSLYAVSFFKTHLANETGFESYLTACYAQAYETSMVLEYRGTHDTVLFATEDSVSVSGGGAPIFFGCAGNAHAGRTYQVLGSLSGTSPGATISGVHVPLNVDSYFFETLRIPNSTALVNGAGTLDAGGRAVAAYHAPANGDPSLVGVTVYHSLVVADGITPSVLAASPAVALTMVP